MDINNMLTIPLSEVDFTGMTKEEIIYIIQNNKNGKLSISADNIEKIKDILLFGVNDPSFAKRLLLELRYEKYFSIYFLRCILHDDPCFELPEECLVKVLVEESALWEIANKYFEVGNYDFIMKNIKYFESILLDWYAFSPHKGKLFLEVLVENNYRLSDKDIANLSNHIMVYGTGIAGPPDQLLNKNDFGETVLERLLKLDKRLGMDIASETVSLPIAAILKKCGFNPKVGLGSDVSYTIDEEFYEQVEGIEYDTRSREYHYPLALTEEQVSLVDQFQKKFEKDSDPTLIKMVLDVFYKYLTYDVNKAMQYLNNFIILKEEYPNFILTHVSHIDKYTGRYNGTISSRYDYYVLNHEMGHAIHDFASEFDYPEHIRIMIEELKNDPDTIRRLQAYALRQQHVIDLARKIVADSFMSYIEKHYPGGYEGYRDNIRSKFDDLISKMKKKYADSMDIFDKFPIEFDDYFEMVTRVNEEYLMKRMLDDHFMFEIENLMDAIFDGRWLDGILEGVTARCYRGHGIGYFQKFLYSFPEVFATFSSLMTVPTDKKEQIEKDLRYLLGDELFDALLQYHNELNDKLGKTR